MNYNAINNVRVNKTQYIYDKTTFWFKGNIELKINSTGLVARA
jgi:hypothetical protein